MPVASSGASSSWSVAATAGAGGDARGADAGVRVHERMLRACQMSVKSQDFHLPQKPCVFRGCRRSPVPAHPWRRCSGGYSRRPPPAVRRRGRRRADGDARRAAHPGFVPCRSVEGAALRRDSGNVGARPLHRDAGAPPYARRPWTAPVAAASGPSPRPPASGWGCVAGAPHP